MSEFFGGKVIEPDNPCYIKPVNAWIILNSGGGLTPDKPEVLLGTPSDLNRVNGFLNLRVADIWACYKLMGRQRSALSCRAIRQSNQGMAPLHARSRRLPHRGRQYTEIALEPSVSIHTSISVFLYSPLSIDSIDHHLPLKME